MQKFSGEVGDQKVREKSLLRLALGSVSPSLDKVRQGQESHSSSVLPQMLEQMPTGKLFNLPARFSSFPTF